MNLLFELKNNFTDETAIFSLDDLSIMILKPLLNHYQISHHHHHVYQINC